MGALLANAVRNLPDLEIVHPVEANVVFARLPRPATDRLLRQLPGDPPFHVWEEEVNVVRWMCAWDTTEEDVDAFAAAVNETVG
jgi:threonine aldolase